MNIRLVVLFDIRINAILLGPQSLCNQRFWWRFLCCHYAFWIFAMGVGTFVIRLSQISSFLSHRRSSINGKPERFSEEKSS